MPSTPGLPLSADAIARARAPLSQAWTLPSSAFTAPDVYEREIDAVMRAEWLCVGRADQIPEPGDYFTVDLFDEKAVVARDASGEIAALSRICRHRAAEVASGSGNAAFFQCPYHAWAFELDGRLKGAPHSSEIEGFDPEACALPKLRTELWEGWIFVNLGGNAPSIASQLAPLSKRLANYRMAEMVAVETATFESPFNWKVLIDNFMEAYHHIATHRDTLQSIFPAIDSHVPDAEGPYSLLVMPARAGETPSSPLPDIGPLAEHERGELVAGVVFPNHLFALAPDFLTWYQLLPERHDQFTLRIYTCFPKEVLDDPAMAPAVEGAQALTRAIHLQDIEACESVWSGLHSPSFEAGRLSKLEKSIWQFNQWWTERMQGAD